MSGRISLTSPQSRMHNRPSVVRKRFPGCLFVVHTLMCMRELKEKKDTRNRCFPRLVFCYFASTRRCLTLPKGRKRFNLRVAVQNARVQKHRKIGVHRHGAERAHVRRRRPFQALSHHPLGGQHALTRCGLHHRRREDGARKRCLCDRLCESLRIRRLSTIVQLCIFLKQ